MSTARPQSLTEQGQKEGIMQLIECPWCGPREEIDFSYGGEAHVRFPDRPAELDDTQWAHYLFFRSNPKGVFAERWSHSAGCRRWFNALRDTVTHRFLAVYNIGEAPPSLSSVGNGSGGSAMSEGVSAR